MAKVMKKAAKKAMKSAKKSGKKSAKKGGNKKKSRRVSKIAHGKRAKASVFRGTKEKTGGGLKKSDLTRSKEGKIVSKKSQAAGRRAYQKNGLAKFTRAVAAARKSLGYTGFVPVGGKTAKGAALLKKTLGLYKK
uniref:Dinoflagellate viral nucleoprotein DVNP.10 n=1 Tax=Hematodinium sp. SG-2012 TaxID=1263730 RepID=K9NTA1_9DINO|nr:dinoflagellate viral nucleoprotein DVNP.10 [Hematodinium sp. SG-2012]